MVLDMNLPTDFMEEVTKNSNDYVEKMRALDPNIQIWAQKYMSTTFDLQPFNHMLD